jgi:hypothetical protein
VVCHCGDCTAYAAWLGRDDAREVVQTSPSRVRITSGIEHVRCAKRSEKGLLRWYAGCCKTPLGNTVRSARAPFVGLMCCTLASRDDAVLGPKVEVQGGRRTSLRVVFRSAWFLLRAWLRGEHTPSPFFDDGGQPITPPRRLSRIATGS